MTTRPMVDSQGRPRSVWSALLTLDRVSYAALVSLAFDAAFLTQKEAAQVVADSLLWEATQTAQHEPLPTGGWLVWIDRQGRAKVQVFP